MAQHGTIIVWFRADLRVHDHPALAAAIEDAEKVIPAFIFDEKQLGGKFASANRNRFLLESLQDLQSSLQEKGGELFVRKGDAEQELLKLVKDADARAVYCIEDYSPFAKARDKKVAQQLEGAGVTLKAFEGKLAVGTLDELLTKTGSPYKVFTPFWKSWADATRRGAVATPKTIKVPNIAAGSLSELETFIDESLLSPDVIKGGETEGRRRLHDFLDDAVHDYHNRNNSLAEEGTSRLSPYLHFGCLSVREIETLLPDGEGARAWHRQLAWRDFYYYVLYHFPNPEREFQERYRNMGWSKNESMLRAWKEGKTGYPVVDAAMRQLLKEGWMHNRARLIVGSFLTKDLGIDWREGEAHFMHWLIDGDMANNNGNWQWIGSVGVDPAPVFRRLYNPTSQRDKFDATGGYVRKYVPELASVSDADLNEPQQVVKEYPAPIVDHKEARIRALEWYRSAS